MTADVPARPPFVRPEVVVAAARRAAAPPGDPPWFLAPVEGGLALRTVVRRWAQVEEPPALRARLACGTALYAARLAVAVQGRRPVVTRPDAPGLVAVLRAGAAERPRPPERAAYAVLRQGPRVRPGLDPRAVLLLLRRAAEAEGAWLRSFHLRPAAPDAEDLGPRWGDPAEPQPTDRTLLVGLDAAAAWPEVRAGQAVQAVLLAAGVAGVDTVVLAAPAAVDVVRSRAVFDGPVGLARPTGPVVVLTVRETGTEPG